MRKRCITAKAVEMWNNMGWCAATKVVEMQNHIGWGTTAKVVEVWDNNGKRKLFVFYRDE